MAFLLTMLGAALACGLEMLEALAIVLAVAATRRPRDAVLGALAALLVCGVLGALLGPALVGRVGGAAPALLGAAVALAATCALGLVLHRPLRRLPETELKYLVGLVLTSFGTFFAAEGLGVQWPLGDAALLVLVAFYLGASQMIAA